MTNVGRSSVAAGIASEFRAANILTAFGHPGGEISVFIEALREAGIQFILTRHETAAAFMAHGYGEMTGRPGVCVATLGPGATNMVTGVANAYLDRAPLIAVTADLATDSPIGKTHQKLDLKALYEPVTKASLAVRSDNATSVTKYAMKMTMEHPRGPVHLALASDVATQILHDGGLESQPDTVVSESLGSLKQAAAQLKEANRPAIVVGLRALDKGIPEAVAALAWATGSAVATTPKAKGVFPESGHLFVGVLEMAGSEIVEDFLKQADLLLLVGLDVVEMDRTWRFDTTTIHVDVLPDTDKFYRATHELVGDIASTIQALITEGPRSRWPSAHLERHRRRLREYICPAGNRLQPWQVIETVQRFFPEETIVTTDTGAHKFLVAQVWRSVSPKTYFLSNGLSSMGYGLPVGGVAALLDPQGPVVSFIGDGGFGMGIGEMETLHRMGVNLLVVIFADGTLELIRRSQLQKQLTPEGTSFRNPSYGALVGSFGAEGFEVSTKEQLSDVLQAKTPIKGVKVVVANINGDDYRL